MSPSVLSFLCFLKDFHAGFSCKVVLIFMSLYLNRRIFIILSNDEDICVFSLIVSFLVTFHVHLLLLLVYFMNLVDPGVMWSWNNSHLMGKLMPGSLDIMLQYSFIQCNPSRCPLSVWWVAHSVSVTPPFQLSVEHRHRHASAIHICPGQTISIHSRSNHLPNRFFSGWTVSVHSEYNSSLQYKVYLLWFPSFSLWQSVWFFMSTFL